MDLREGSESIFSITVTKEISLRDLVEFGAEDFAKEARKLLEEELRPLLEIPWKTINRVPSPPSPQAAPSSTEEVSAASSQPTPENPPPSSDATDGNAVASESQPPPRRR
jgi:hypothetical protein